MNFDSYEDLMKANYKIYKMVRPSAYYGNAIYAYIAAPSPIKAIVAFKSKYSCRPDDFTLLPPQKNIYDAWCQSILLLVVDSDGSVHENKKREQSNYLSSSYALVESKPSFISPPPRSSEIV